MLPILKLNPNLVLRHLLLGDDSVNGSKTQSTVTTESNTPDNTLRLDNLAQKTGVNYTIEDGEVILESKQLTLDIIKTNFHPISHSYYYRRH